MAVAQDRRQDEDLAAVLGKTEIIDLNFHQCSGLSWRGRAWRGQALLDMLRHPKFNIKDVQSTTTLQLIRRLELLFTECAVSTTTYAMMEARA